MKKIMTLEEKKERAIEKMHLQNELSNLEKVIDREDLFFLINSSSPLVFERIKEFIHGECLKRKKEVENRINSLI